MHFKYAHADYFKDVPKADFENLSGKLVIYGAGLQGLLTAYLLRQRNVKVICFVDRDENKQGTTYYGLPVISPAEMKKINIDFTVIVTPSQLMPAWRYMRDEMGIKNLITPFSLCLDFDSSGFDQLEELPSWYRPDALDYHLEHFLLRCVNLLTEYSLFGIDFSVSEICNLRCKHCNALMPCYKNPRAFEIEDVKRDILTVLTGRKIQHINLEGGETFLWKPLPDLIRWMNDRPEILRYIIPVTNGTVIPSKELLEALSLSKVSVKISDYGDISKKYEIVELFEKYGVKYWVQQQKWYALEALRKEPADDETYEKVIKSCAKAEGSSTRYVSDGKLYCCPNHANFHKLGIFPSKEGEYIDLRRTDIENLQKDISCFLDVKREVKCLPQLCKHCAGRGFAGIEVPPAEQLKKNQTIQVRFE